MADPQDPQEPVGGSPDLKMPEVAKSKGIVTSFPKGQRVPDAGVPTATPVNTTLPAKRTKHQLQVMREERRQLAYDLWLENVPSREIGRRLGCSHPTILRAIDAYRQAIERHGAATMERRRDWLIQQHQKNQRELWKKTTQPGPTGVLAHEAITQSLKEVAKLTGTYAPTKVASTNPDGTQWVPFNLALHQVPTAHLEILKKYQTMKVLGSAEAMDAQVIDVDVVKTGS